MTIAERTVGAATVLELSGRLVLGDGDEPLKTKVRDVIRQGVTHVMLNMTGVTYIDSAGLGALVGVSLSARHDGRTITVVNPSARLRQLLAVARLQHVVKISESEEQALGRG